MTGTGTPRRMVLWFIRVDQSQEPVVRVDQSHETVVRVDQSQEPVGSSEGDFGWIDLMRYIIHGWFGCFIFN